MFDAKMIHISSWPATTIDLMRVALPLLREDGVLIIHGTYVVDGEIEEKTGNSLAVYKTEMPVRVYVNCIK